MLALYRDGQSARALEVGAQAKRVLADELGIDAGPEVRDLEVRILRQAPELNLPAAGITVGHAEPPARLPADDAWFTGRAAELEALDAILATDGRPGSQIAILTGPGGVGKTALALRWANAARDRFPDGRLFADLRGSSDGSAVRPVDMIGRLLGTLGIRADRVPGDADGAAAAYRNALNRRRVLIVLDNAADADQVRPLLPVGGGCAVIITSRRRLDDLVARDGARHVGLSSLSGYEATSLLGRAIGDARVADEPRAAAELARLCGYLPLALRLAAAALATAPRRSIADYVATLSGDHPAAPQAADDARRWVQAAFEVSYADLDTCARRLFRLLSVAPTAEVTFAAAAALADIDPCTAEQSMRRLAEAHLVDEVAAGRFALHEMLRRYAAERAAHEDAPTALDAAVDRVLWWYVSAVRTAVRLVYPHTLRLDGRDVPTDAMRVGFAFSSAPARGDAARRNDTRLPKPGDSEGHDDPRTGAVGWLDTEHPTLAAVAEYAAKTGRDRVAWLIADALRGYFWHTRLAGPWLRLAHAGLDAAVRGRDARAEVAMRLNLACVYHCLARRSSAIDEYLAARALARRIGWTEAEESTLTSLGVAYADVGNLTAAVDTLREALSLTRSRMRRAVVLVNLGSVLHHMGRLADSVRHHEAALDLARRADFAAGEATALQFLGYTEHAVGALPEALEHLTLALWVHRRTGNRHQEAQTLMDIASVHLDAGRCGDAQTTIDAALDLVRERSEQHAESFVLAMRGRIRLAAGRVDDSIADYGASLELARRARGLYAQAEAEIGLADAYRAAGRHADALARVDAALEMAERTGYRALTGQALTVRAAVRTAVGDPCAFEDAERAVAIQRETGYRMAEARALRALADAVRTKDPAAAARHERAAADIVDQVAARRRPVRVRRVRVAIDEPQTA
jgi:tetratricopeptide (TPR) repeat protein